MESTTKTPGATCDRCTKEDCTKCVVEDENNFCCQNCCDEFKKEKAGEKKDEPINVCRFC